MGAHVFKYTYVNFIVTIFNHLSTTNKFIIQSLRSDEDVRTLHAHVHYMSVRTSYNHYFQSCIQYQQLCHTETKIYVHHPYPRTLYGCVRHCTVTIFSPLSNTNNFATQTSHRNEGLRTSPIPTHIVWMCTSAYGHYF